MYASVKSDIYNINVTAAVQGRRRRSPRGNWLAVCLIVASAATGLVLTVTAGMRVIEQVLHRPASRRAASSEDAT